MSILALPRLQRRLKAVFSFKNVSAKSVVLFLGFLLFSAIVYANDSATTHSHNYNQDRQKITIKVKNEKLATVFDKIEKMANYVFVYSNDDINVRQRVSLDAKEQALEDVLTILTKQINAQFQIINDKIIIKHETVKEGLIEKNIQETTLNDKATYSSLIVSKLATIITGWVTDNNGNGIPDVSITLKGTAIGVSTDAAGRFSITIPDDQLQGTLVFTSVGFIEVEEKINNRRNIPVTLEREEKQMEEVVVVGYGTQRRSSLTGAVDKVGSKAIEGRPVINLTQALQGTSPNLIIQQRNFEPGQELNLNIRGLGTLGNNSPLVVIDGIVGGNINLINPNDIESVSILKDAGSAAIYGSRSANGVLLITTKKGKKNEQPSVSYSGIYGIQTPRVTVKPVHAWENAYYKNESLANSGLQPFFTPDQIQEFKDRGDGNWRVDNILQRAGQQNHNITLSGGSANSTYLLSVGFLDQASNFIGPDYGYKRYNIRFNQTTDIGKFKLASSLSYVKVNGKDHSSSSGTLMVDAGRVPLYYSFQDSAGNYLTNPVSAEMNPKAVLENGGYRRSNDDEIFGSLSGEYQLTKDLKVRGVFGGTVRSNSMYGRRMHLTFSPGGQYGADREVRDNNYKSLMTNLQLLLEYDKVIGRHKFKIMGGTTNESFRSEESSIIRTLTDPNLGTPTTGTVIQTDSRNSNQGIIETSLNSLLGRVAYEFDNRYFFEASIRYDGSSNFAKNNRWGVFPSVSAAWKLTDENVSFLRYIKDNLGTVRLRTSYGILGNQNVSPYQYQTSFFNYQNAYGFNNTVVGGTGFSLGNPNLTWEKAATFNIGVDASLFNGRLDLSYDYFDKTTSDILVRREDVPLLYGAGFPDFNSAEVRNQGWEVRATYHLRGKNLTQSISLNLADNLNQLRSFTFGARQLVERREEYEFVRRIGQPITVYQGYRVDGFFQNSDDLKNAPIFDGQIRSALQPGDLRFVDRNGDGVINERDKFILGNPFPRYTFGFTYTAAIKGFDVLLLIQGVGKRDAMLRGELIEPFHFGYGGTMYTHQTDYWTPTNPSATYPRLAESGSVSNLNNYRTGSDIYLFDAAYARLKNVQLGYSIPQTVLDKVKLKRARVYLTGQNLLTLSKLGFIDPEITEFDSNTSFNTGANSARAYPLPVFFGFGLDITF